MDPFVKIKFVTLIPAKAAHSVVLASGVQCGDAMRAGYSAPTAGKLSPSPPLPERSTEFHRKYKCRQLHTLVGVELNEPGEQAFLLCPVKNSVRAGGEVTWSSADKNDRHGPVKQHLERLRRMETTWEHGKENKRQKRYLKSYHDPR
ncbi:hypothetical protein VULLAG_LOCUS11867 [Vulpes lagopus]